MVIAVALIGWKREMIKGRVGLCDTQDWGDLLSALNDGSWGCTQMANRS
jgi:hypothetical protein